MPPNVPVAPVIVEPDKFPENAALPLLSILKLLEAITPFDSIILVPAVVKAEPSAFVGFKFPEDILPVVILSPLIVVTFSPPI